MNKTTTQIREEFIIALLITREASGIQTLKLSLPEELYYRVRDDRLVCGFSVEYQKDGSVYLGNAWSSSGIMTLHKLARAFFKHMEHYRDVYVLHSRPEITPLWKRLGFIETGKTVKHKEVLINGEPLIAVEMVKE